MSVGGSNASWTGSDFKDAVLNSTNTYREQYGAEALEWDSELADFAEDHAENCIWKHSEDGPYGENLAVNYPSPTLSIDAWANEEEDFDWEKRTFSESVGHFTQLVWQNTTTVGCAAVECHDTSDDGANGWFLVCEYAPAGNVKGAFKTNVLKPGMSEEGEVGLGSAGPKMGGGARSVLALAVATVLTGMFL